MIKSIEEELKETADRNVIDFRKWEISNVLLLGKYKYKQTHALLDMHLHPNIIEICYCSKGEQIYEVNGQSYKLKGGDVFVTFPDEPHSSAQFPENRGEMYWLMIIVPDKLNPSLLNFSKLQTNSLIKKIKNIPKRHFKGNSKMKSFLEQIFVISRQNNHPLNQVKITCLLTSFLLEFIDCSVQNKDKKIHPGFDELLQYINDHIDQQLSIDILAKKINLSQSRFKSLFKEMEGMPPHEYILRQKLEFGLKIMNEKNSNMTEAAFQAGFSSVFHFSNTFKKFKGKRPSTIIAVNR